MKKVLVTGATGFIGQHALRSLSQRGFEVYGLTHHSQAPAEMPATGWFTADLFDAASVEAVLRELRPTHLLHLAWDTTPGRYWTSLDNFRWVQASLDLLRLFQECGGQRVVGAGSCAEYEWDDGLAPRAEDTTPLRPATVYGTCKNALRGMVDAYSRETGMSSAWGRVFFVYGPGEKPERLVPSVIRALLSADEARCSEGTQVRDFLHVQDVATGFAALVDSDVSGAYNIASGDKRPVREIVCRTAEIIGRPDLLRLGALPQTASEPDFLYADSRKLRRATGWSPQWFLRDGLRDTVAWWKGQQLQGSGS